MPKKNMGGKKNVTSIKNSATPLDGIFVEHLKILYDVENQLVKALPKMAKKASNRDLKSGIERHLRQTQGHADRIEQIFDILDAKPQKLQSQAIRGLIADTDSILKNVKGQSLDSAIISCAQSVEHYEMAMYITAIGWAKLLDKSEVADLLQETLDEEQETSDELAELAHSEVDETAMGGESKEHDSENSHEDDEEEDQMDDDEEEKEDENEI